MRENAVSRPVHIVIKPWTGKFEQDISERNYCRECDEQNPDDDSWNNWFCH